LLQIFCDQLCLRDNSKLPCSAAPDCKSNVHESVWQTEDEWKSNWWEALWSLARFENGRWETTEFLFRRTSGGEWLIDSFFLSTITTNFELFLSSAAAEVFFLLSIYRVSNGNSQIKRINSLLLCSNCWNSRQKFALNLFWMLINLTHIHYIIMRELLFQFFLSLFEIVPPRKFDRRIYRILCLLYYKFWF